MKQKPNYSQIIKLALLIAVTSVIQLEVGAQICSDPANIIYGLTSTGQIRPITVSTGAVGVAINPPYSGVAPSLANANGYNPLNGKFYFFKRNSSSPPQQFMSFDPATGLYQMLAPSPAANSTIINLGCVTANGLGYYCLDANGVLYYYRIATNTWTTICTNIINQFGTTLNSIIDPSGIGRVYGDLAIDGFGNMWMIISGTANYGLYKIDAPLPIIPVVNLMARQILPPTTPASMGSFGGIAFNSTGQMLMSSNTPDNRLFRMENNYTLTFISNLSVAGVGNDLTSCNFPLFVLSSPSITFSASIKNQHSALITWTIAQSLNTNGYSIEYSADGKQWYEISYMQKTGNDLSKTYSYTHDNLVNGTHYYRLRVTEYNGITTYSSIKRVDIAQSASLSIWPNPASDQLKVQLSSTSGSGSTLFLYDKTGRLLSQGVLQIGITSVNIKNFTAGSYIARIQHANGTVTNQQFIKQ